VISRRTGDGLLMIYEMQNMSSSWADCLICQAAVRYFAPVGDERRRLLAERSEFVGRSGELGAVLADLRRAKGLTLRQVEEGTGKAVSNAYLSQLENGRIRKPSPNVLHSLAEVYAVPYETLMEKAGYLLPSQKGGGHRRRLKAFAIDDLTAEEEEELLKYLAFLRSRNRS
jgi:transcriptional regulator with XRE-family HTH domain